MLFSLIILVLVGVIAYFHYLQGFFSATISAVLAVISAVLAVGYHEVVTNMVGNTYMPEYAAGASLVAIFAVTYIVLRVVFDAAVPGNVHFALMVDRIGAACMGVVAGVFAAGVLAIAAQTLPFGPAVAGHSRYPVEFEKKAAVRLEQGPALSDAVYDQLDAEKFIRNESGDASGLWVPADSVVLKLVSLVSREGGSLDCGRSFESHHPDYLQELFGQRVGIQAGSRHSAGTTSLDVTGVFIPAGTIIQDDPERWTRDGQPVGIRGGKTGGPALPREFRPASGKAVLVVRARPENGSADAGTNVVAFTPASARLVANHRNYFPIGTMEGGRILYRNAVDDALFVPTGKAVDLVYEVPEADVLQPAKDKTAAPKIAPDVFVEFKRSARADLSLKQTTKGVTSPGDAVEVVRKEGTPAVASSVKTTLTIKGVPVIGATLSFKVNPNTEENNATGETTWGRYAMVERCFTQLEVNPVSSLQEMESGRGAGDELSVPDGQVMLQLTGTPAGDDRWKWADSIDDYVLEDASNTLYKPKGAYVKVNNNGKETAVARYDAQKGVSSLPAAKNMRPTDVVLLFTVPSRCELKFLHYKGELLQPMQFKAVAQ